VTIEDLVEEIVGDIEDEHDDAPEALIVALGGGLWEADARAELEDVATTIDARLGDIDDDVDTIGGLAFMLAGHVPQPGETLLHASGWQIEITEGDARRATRVRLHPPALAQLEA
jgi:CBS domain containing-hemolysin-like protein